MTREGGAVKGWILLLLLAVLLMAGCRSSMPERTPRPETPPERTPETTPEPRKEPPRSFPRSPSVPYNILNDSCMCEEYTAKDPKLPVTYKFTAHYEVKDRVTTRIELTLENNGNDTLRTSMGYVRVTSRNVAYQYNDKFVPLPMEPIPPHDKRTLTLAGTAVKSNNEDPWVDMAGEQLVVTVKGLRLGKRRLAEQNVTFIPQNPRFNE